MHDFKNNLKYLLIYISLKKLNYIISSFEKLDNNLIFMN